jgi:hypothetical protein
MATTAAPVANHTGAKTFCRRAHRTSPMRDSLAQEGFADATGARSCR